MKHKRPPTNGKDMQIKTICKLLPKKTGKKTFPKEYLLPDAVVHSRQFSLTAVAMCGAHLPWGVASRSQHFKCPLRAVPGGMHKEPAGQLVDRVNGTGARRVPWPGPASDGPQEVHDGLTAITPPRGRGAHGGCGCEAGAARGAGSGVALDGSLRFPV